MAAGRDLDAQLAQALERVELAGRARLAHQHVGTVDDERLGGGRPRDPCTDHDHAPTPEVLAHPRPPLLMKST